MKKCVNKDCDYFKKNSECSSTCTERGIKKVITQYDRIQTMSLDEMAAEFAKEDSCQFCKLYESQTCDNTGCKKGIRQFLESKVEE